MNTTTNITEGSLKLFIELANDAGNWSGTPLFGGNVGGDKSSKGHLTHLKRLKLVRTDAVFGLDSSLSWVYFTPEGKALAAEHGINL